MNDVMYKVMDKVMIAYTWAIVYDRYCENCLQSP